MGPTEQWFPRASPHIKKGHNKYIYILCPTLTWLGKHKYDKSCLKKETPEERKGWKTLPRPLKSETASATSTAVKDSHQTQWPFRAPRWNGDKVHASSFTQFTAQTELQNLLEDEFRKETNCWQSTHRLNLSSSFVIRGWGVISEMLANPISSKFQCFRPLFFTHSSSNISKTFANGITGFFFFFKSG